MKNEETKKGKNKLGFLKKFFSGKVMIAIVIVLAICAGAIGMKKFISSESKTTKIGFENIGELATQTAYCTEVNVTEASREMFGITIPFTQSKYIYSYDIEIKAGLDFNDVEWNMKDKTIEVKLPEIKVLSSEINLESFKVYHEDESIFRPIKLEENNEAMANLRKNAEKSAVENGLLNNARGNAETVLKSFFGQVYDLEQYQIKFVE